MHEDPGVLPSAIDRNRYKESIFGKRQQVIPLVEYIKEMEMQKIQESVYVWEWDNF